MPRLSILSCLLLAISSTCFAQDDDSTFSVESVTSTCRQLSTALPGKVFSPGSTPYSSSVASYFYIQNRLSPSCFVKPTTSQDVSLAINVLGKTKSKFAVKGGGHATNRYWSNIDNGITIDLAAMKKITVNEQKLTAAVGPGALSEDVYKELDARGMSFLGGRVADVGVAGFTTGGMFCIVSQLARF